LPAASVTQSSGNPPRVG